MLKLAMKLPPRMNLFQYHHVPWVRRLRSLARSAGMVGVIRRMVGTSPNSQEEAFQRALKAAIRNNDIVWDIGANVGFYTTQFLEWTGPAGKVVAFEPLPEAFRALKDSLDKTTFAGGRYLLHQAALTDFDGEVFFTTDRPANDSISTISHISDAPNGATEGGEKVRALRVDSVVEQLGAPWPSVTKLDVEGYEEEVLLGGRRRSRGRNTASFLSKSISPGLRRETRVTPRPGSWNS